MHWKFLLDGWDVHVLEASGPNAVVSPAPHQQQGETPTESIGDPG